MIHNDTIVIDYTDQQLRVLVEEYIIQQRSTFTLQGVCNYVLYWAMEDGHTIPASIAIYESSQLATTDCERVSAVLEKIVKERRITCDGVRYMKIMD